MLSRESYSNVDNENLGKRSAQPDRLTGGSQEEDPAKKRREKNRLAQSQFRRRREEGVKQLIFERDQLLLERDQLQLERDQFKSQRNLLIRRGNIITSADKITFFNVERQLAAGQEVSHGELITFNRINNELWPELELELDQEAEIQQPMGTAATNLFNAPPLWPPSESSQLSHPGGTTPYEYNYSTLPQSPYIEGYSRPTLPSQFQELVQESSYTRQPDDQGQGQQPKEEEFSFTHQPNQEQEEYPSY
jgi:hypothetical protein